MESVPQKTYENRHHHTYDLVKSRFEKKCFRLNNPFCYVTIHGEDPVDYQVHTHKGIQNYFCALKYYSGAPRHDYLPFVPRWLNDSSKRVVESMDIKKRKGCKRAKTQEQ